MQPKVLCLCVTSDEDMAALPLALPYAPSQLSPSDGAKRSVGTLLEKPRPCGLHREPHNPSFVFVPAVMKEPNLANGLIKEKQL